MKFNFFQNKQSQIESDRLEGQLNWSSEVDDLSDVKAEQINGGADLSSPINSLASAAFGSLQSSSTSNNSTFNQFTNAIGSASASGDDGQARQ